MARAICDRHTGVGADGWILLRNSRKTECGAKQFLTRLAVRAAPFALLRDTSIRLFNADGSEAEMSGNGTRCAAALLIDSGQASKEITILTGAGPKHLRLLDRRGRHFLFEMDMGKPAFVDSQIRFSLPLQKGPCEVTILDVGNPQCAVFVEDFPDDWATLGAEIEAHPHFPKHTNVSFVRSVDAHTIEARFFERGAGVTLSSGTGSTGAAVASILRRLATSPVEVRTPAGDTLRLRWDDSVFLTGPAELIATGEFFVPGS